MMRTGGSRQTAFLRLWLSLAAVLLLSGSVARAQEEEGNISGQVRLPDGTFGPVRLQVTLEAHGAVADVAYCDDEGRFDFGHVLPNAYEIVIRADGFQPVSLSVLVHPKVMPTNIVHIVLQPLAKRFVGIPAGQNKDEVGISDLMNKYPPQVKKEFEAGQRAEQKNDIAGAIKHYRATIRLAPEFYQAHNNLGGAYIEKGDYKAAEQELRRALQLNPKSAQAEFNLGNVLLATGRYAEAKQTLDEGLSHNPTSAMGHYFLGSVLVRLREFGPAEEQLKSAQQLDPKMPQIRIALATLYLQTGRKTEAVKAFEEYLKEFPEDPLAPKVRAAVNELSR
jgi:Tfp pilus assembly protein PilF